MRNLLISLMIVGVASVAQAEDHFYQGASVGYMLWDDERFSGQDDTGGQLGLQLGYQFFNSTAAVELSAMTDISGPEFDLYQLSLINYLGDSSEARPYWIAGFAYSDSDEPFVVNEAFSGVIGLGVSQMIDDRMELRADARVYPAIDTNSLDGIVDWGLNLAINYHFGDQGSSPAPAAKPAPAPEPAPAPVRRAAPPAPVAPAEVEETRTITIRLNVEFETNSANVSAVYGDEIQEVANAMAAQSGIELILEGHTDSAGAEEYNQSLSQRRVEAVRGVLVEQYGIDADRVTAVGYGESRPIADNATAEGRARNRRVVGVISWDEVVD